MHTLNDPVDYAVIDEEWTPAIGLSRAAVQGLIAALILAALITSLTLFQPLFSISVWVRMILALIVAWILFRTVQNAAQMTGWRVTALVVGLTLLVMYSQHIVLAVHGAPVGSAGECVRGWVWLHPLVFVVGNAPSLIALPFVAVLLHRGSCPGGLEVLADVLTMGIWGSRR
ncbi:MAG: hypothetical protein KAY37_15925 [Phycisphaerae bacterium]|nr:hypothetical protein [Phycisphaerae bacterium]